MANYAQLKAAIQQAVDWDNNNKEISGPDMLGILNTMINSLGAGYIFAGVAKLTPTQTDPGTPDQNVFYIAAEPGTYTNFPISGGYLQVAENEVAIFKYNGTWQKDSTGAATAASVTELGQYEDNPEWVRVVTDNDGKILYGVKTDGKFYFGDGCPPQVRGFIEERIASKVDVVAGKSLIDSLFASAQSIVNNPEWMEVKTDNYGRVIAARTRDGVLHEKVGIKTKQLSLELLNLTLDEQERISNLGRGRDNPRAWFNSYGYVEEAKGSEKIKPILYKLNMPSNTMYFGAVVYPDGTIFYSNYGTIMRRNLDGTTNTLLTVPGSTQLFDFLWFDSSYNLYTSPRSVSKDENNANSGIYRLAYGADSFEHVMSLYDPNSQVPSEQTMNSDNIRNITEDKDGNLYAGVYGGLNGERYNPKIYKSTDGGLTWSLLIDMSAYVPGGKHIHAVKYNQYDNRLYCVVGEVNMLLRSSDGGVTWEDMNCPVETGKGFSIEILPDGLLLGSDDAYIGGISKVYGDGTYKTVARLWALSFPDIKVSELTGWIYAFSWIDGTALDPAYYPPTSAINDPSALQDWIDSSPAHLQLWQEYNAAMSIYSPQNAIVPTQFAILVSRDSGETWEILKVFSRLEYNDAQGIRARSAGYFMNGEIVFVIGQDAYVLSEGKHGFTPDGISCAGECFIRLNRDNSTIVLDIM